ncbi:hypothetical protein Taro_002820 [Colocasia esculenta]|uniref:Uncharacterized protein n=1 Tax=Colocasia esculenta TaxID=4460 RepID=A0A843TMI0_COLES|nr:hypothetical protein [Colocasia esculenta]
MARSEDSIEDSSGGLRRLEDSLNIEEHFPDSGVQQDSSHSPKLGGFGGFLALAEESFFDLLFPLLIFPEAKMHVKQVLNMHMATRGRRGGVPARKGEQRREEQAEQQAPAPQGPVLPPPPPVDYGVFMQGLVQAMQMQAHTQAALQAQLEAQVVLQERADVWWASLLRTRFEDGAIVVAWDETRLVAFDHHTLDEALSAACRQEGEMEQYLEEKKASQKRPATPFQWQDKKKAVYQSPQHPVAASSTQVPSQLSPSVKKECPHCGRTHGGTECWIIVGKFLKCGSSDHKIKDCLRLQQGVQHGAPAPAAVAVASPATGRLGRPRAQARGARTMIPVPSVSLFSGSPPLHRDPPLSDLTFSMAPKGKRAVPRQRPISPKVGEGSRATTEHRTKHWDDRLPELIVPPNLHTSRVWGTFTKFVQPRYVHFESLEDMFPGLQPLFDTQGWTVFLYSHMRYSPTAVTEFYINLEMSVVDEALYTMVRGTTFQITPNLFSRALQLPNSGANILLNPPFASEYYTIITHQLYHPNYDHLKLNTNTFPPLNRLIHHIFTTRGSQRWKQGTCHYNS